MTDAEAFLQAIAADPEDDIPRLVFADWLEERGEPARAELIRVQCELARLTQENSRWFTLAFREVELLARHEIVWTTPLRGWVDEWHFRRGFIEKVTIIPFHFVRWGEELFRQAPVRHVHFYRRNHVASGEVEALAASPFLERLQSFKLNTDRGIRDDAVSIIAGTPSLSQLTCLDLSDNWIEDRGAQALANSPYLANLQSLRLGRNRITRQGRQTLVAQFGGRVSF